eukprot:COSAG02_NODE_8412_length_2582_cov_1.536851_2_plen_77_part_00
MYARGNGPRAATSASARVLQAFEAYSPLLPIARGARAKAQCVHYSIICNLQVYIAPRVRTAYRTVGTKLHSYYSTV